jgi:DNA-binding protein HU-beta
MLKPDLVEKVAKAMEQSKSAKVAKAMEQSKSAVDAVTLVDAVISATLEVITSALKKGEKVQFVGFGTFEVKNRAARVGMNPLTKEKLRIPANKVPTFKAGAVLKQAVGRKKK